MGNGVVYFPGFAQVSDPSISQITSQGNLNQLSTMKAIANASGQLVYVNPLPGQLGSLAIDSLTGPRVFRIDLNVIKRIGIKERLVAQIGATAENPDQY